MTGLDAVTHGAEYSKRPDPVFVTTPTESLFSLSFDLSSPGGGRLSSGSFLGSAAHLRTKIMFKVELKKRDYTTNEEEKAPCCEDPYQTWMTLIRWYSW